MTRRREVIASAAGISALIAGCLGDTDEQAGTSEGANDGGGTDDPTEPADADEAGGGNEEDEDRGNVDHTPTDHAAARDLGSQPTLGDPASAPATIVEFSDPGCGVCAAFHDGNFQDIERELIEPGKSAFVFRPYPVREVDVSYPGSHALFATHDRDPDAFWPLVEFYYDEHGSLSEDDIYDRTASFLEENTSVNGDAVADDARSEAYSEEIDANLDTGRSAGAGGETPVFYLFDKGEFVTEVRGNQNLEVFRTALGF